MAEWWGGGTGANPQAEADYFKRVIGAGDVTPFNGLFFNDPANDRSRRTWYNEQGMVVPGYGTEGPAGPAGAGGGGGPAGGIEQIMNDMTLQRISKTFGWTGDSLPGIKSFQGGGYWWSQDPNTFAVPRPVVRVPQIRQIVDRMVQQRGTSKLPPGEVGRIMPVGPPVRGWSPGGNPFDHKNPFEAI